MEKVRYGVVGYGNMGTSDSCLVRDKIKEIVITAICDTNPERLKKAKEDHPEAKMFDSYDEMLKSGEIDAVYIATPHYDHPEMTLKALDTGLHALCEKPAGVYTRQVREMYEAAKGHEKLFAMMFNQRPHPAHQKVKDLIDKGELGTLRRMSWIITDWYRTQNYYNSGGWRATWEGEGGGVLINQCPHQLDLWQWFFGMPKRVRAFCGFGKFHDIEVEDDVTTYMEYENGATGVFITTTGEAPGTNRLEICGTRGKLVLEGGKITFTRNEEPTDEHLKTCKGGFDKPDVWNIDIPLKSEGGFGHQEVHQNFANAIIKDEKLIALGEEGINGLTLGNLMLLSGWTDDWAETPIDENKFYEILQEKIKNSTNTKDKNASVVADLSNSSTV